MSWSLSGVGATSAATVDTVGAKYNIYTLQYVGTLVDEDTFGGVEIRQTGTIDKVTLECADAPTGADVQVDLTIGGSEQTKVATLTDASTVETTTLGSTLAVSSGEVLGGKIKQIGSSTPGVSLTMHVYVLVTTETTGFTVPTDANQEHSALTADRALTSSDVGFIWLEPDADGWDVDMPSSFSGNMLYLKNSDDTYSFSLFQSDGTTSIIEFPPGYGCVLFYNEDTSAWEVA